MNKWFELTLEAGAMLTPEEIDEALVNAGAVAVTMQDGEDNPIFEPLPGETPLWSTTLVTGLFELPCDVEAIKESLSESLNEPFLPIVVTKDIEDKDWVGAWQDNYKPIKFGDNLWICPTHLEPPEPEVTTVMLDPGLAFGTGTHPTTALCLEWLSDHKERYFDKAVIDYGCGSGILGVAAKKLGAGVCFSTDIDPQAIRAAEQNANRNGVEVNPTLPEDFNPEPAAVLLANILANPLIDLAPLLTKYVVSGGDIVLSGLLEHDAENVQAAYEKYFTFEAPQEREGWVRLHGVKR